MTHLVVYDLEARNGAWSLGPVSLELTPGCVALVGVNGAGKSTLIRTLVGLQIPTAGRVVLDGGDLGNKVARRHASRHVGYLPQEMRLPSSATVEQALAYYAWLKDLESSAVADRIGWALDLVDLADRRKTRISKLSGGQRQRVAIASAWVHDPEVLVLDEPTIGLDPLQRVEIRQRMIEAGRNKLLLVSTHLAEDVAAMADVVVVLHDGQVRFDGPLESLNTMAEEGDPGSSLTERALWRVLGGTG